MLLEKMREKGIYVVCIVRNHMQAEVETVYKVLNQKLKLIEKKELSRLIQKRMNDKKTGLNITGAANHINRIRLL